MLYSLRQALKYSFLFLFHCAQATCQLFGDTMTFMSGLLQWTTCFIMFQAFCVTKGVFFVQHAVAYHVQTSHSFSQPDFSHQLDLYKFLHPNSRSDFSKQ